MNAHELIQLCQAFPQGEAALAPLLSQIPLRPTEAEALLEQACMGGHAEAVACLMRLDTMNVDPDRVGRYLAAAASSASPELVRYWWPQAPASARASALSAAAANVDHPATRRQVWALAGADTVQYGWRQALGRAVALQHWDLAREVLAVAPASEQPAMRAEGVSMALRHGTWAWVIEQPVTLTAQQLESALLDAVKDRNELAFVWLAGQLEQAAPGHVDLSLVLERAVEYRCVAWLPQLLAYEPAVPVVLKALKKACGGSHRLVYPETSPMVDQLLSYVPPGIVEERRLLGEALATVISHPDTEASVAASVHTLVAAFHQRDPEGLVQWLESRRPQLANPYLAAELHAHVPTLIPLEEAVRCTLLGLADAGTPAATRTELNARLRAQIIGCAVPLPTDLQTQVNRQFAALEFDTQVVLVNHLGYDGQPDWGAAARAWQLARQPTPATLCRRSRPRA